jgi:hypothetical protein
LTNVNESVSFAGMRPDQIAQKRQKFFESLLVTGDLLRGTLLHRTIAIMRTDAANVRVAKAIRYGFSP